MRVLWLILRGGGWRLFFRMRWVRGRSRGGWLLLMRRELE